MKLKKPGVVVGRMRRRAHKRKPVPSTRPQGPSEHPNAEARYAVLKTAVLEAIDKERADGLQEEDARHLLTCAIHRLASADEHEWLTAWYGKYRFSRPRGLLIAFCKRYGWTQEEAERLAGELLVRSELGPYVFRTSLKEASPTLLWDGLSATHILCNCACCESFKQLEQLGKALMEAERRGDEGAYEDTSSLIERALNRHLHMRLTGLCCMPGDWRDFFTEPAADVR